MGWGRYWSINELNDPQKAKLGQCSFSGTGHEFHVKHTAACPGGYLPGYGLEVTWTG